MGILKSFWEEIPIIYRRLTADFFKNLFAVFLAFFLLALFVSALGFLNFAKHFSFGLFLEYSLSSSAVYTPLFVPVLELIAVALTLYPLTERKLNWIVLAAGISSSEFAKPFLVASLLPALLLFLHFQILYPYAGYIQHIDYLRAKNKPLREGVIENFWYKNRKGEFLYFRLVHLGSEEAFDGRHFAVDKNYHLKWVSYIPRATFRVESDRIEVLAKDIKRYTPKRVEKIPALRLEFPYEIKLLRVRNPAYFSTTELLSLVSFARGVGINYYPYLWELVKRLLLVALSVSIPLLAVVYLFGSIKREEFIEKGVLLTLSVVAFYASLILFQTLVLKVSLNPLYGLLLALPHTFWSLKVLTKGGG